MPVNIKETLKKRAADRFALIAFAAAALLISPAPFTAFAAPSAVPGEVLVQFTGPAPALAPAAASTTAPPTKIARRNKLRQYRFAATNAKFTPNRGLERIARRHRLIGAEPLFDAACARQRKLAPHGTAYSTDASRLHRLVFPRNADVGRIAAELSELPGVQFAEPNHLSSLSYTPADPLWPQQQSDWQIIGAENAWDQQLGGADTLTVAVLDSGVETIHPELSGALDLANSYNFVDGNANLFDDIGHGTRVAGIIAADADNTTGIAGLAFGCKIMALDVATSAGQVANSDLAAAINWAAANGADIINMSLGSYSYSQAVKEACDNAYAAGVLLVAAARNENQGRLPVFPASFDSVIGVGAVDDGGTSKALWSNYNDIEEDLVELVAPGETIFAPIPGEQYNKTEGSGTSFAAPIVAGAAALLMSQNPRQSAPAIRRHLNRTATTAALTPPGGATPWYGSGLVHAGNALNTPMTPKASIAAAAVQDATALSASNDDDGAFDDDETARLVLTLSTTNADAHNVTATLSTADPDVVQLGANIVNFGDLPIGQLVANGAAPFGPIVIRNGVQNAKRITFSLQLVGDTGYNETITFDLRLEVEQLLVTPGGLIASNRTWRVQENLLIGSGTIVEPGTVIKVEPGYNIQIAQDGNLSAVGTPANPILITRASTSGANWGFLRLSPVSATGGENVALHNVIVEHGAGVLVEQIFAPIEITDCTIRHNTQFGLRIAEIGEVTVSNVHAIANGGAGIAAPFSALSGCTADENLGDGLVGATLIDCSAHANAGNGLTAQTATKCTATSNTGTGLIVNGDALDLIAKDNGGDGVVCNNGDLTSATSARNAGAATTLIGLGRIEKILAVNNGGGIVTEGVVVIRCEVEYNAGTGVSNPSGTGNTAVQFSRIIGNAGPPLSGITDITDSVVANNGQPLSVSGSATSCYVNGNGGGGVTGGVISSSAIFGNAGPGASNSTSLNNSWIVNNQGIGVASTGGVGTVDFCTIRNNRGVGVENILSVSGSNIYDNLYYDARSTVTGPGVPDWNFAGNYWGVLNTASLLPANPGDNLPFLWDQLDGSGDYAINVWPYLPTPASNAPSNTPPTFLLNVVPSIDDQLYATSKKTTFTLTFSKPMDTAVEPSVKFGAAPPYADHVVEPAGASGWLDNSTWQGFFNIAENKAGVFLNTLRVENAIDATGFVLPSDTSRQFFIDTKNLVANNGLASGLGSNQMLASWSPTSQSPATYLGYNIRRKKLSDPGAHVKINSSIVTSAYYIDGGLQPSTGYSYIVDLVDTNNNSTQWTSPFFDATDPSGQQEPSLAIIGGSIGVAANGAPTSAVVAVVSDEQDANGSLAVAASGAPTGMTVIAVNTNGTVTVTITVNSSVAAGAYQITLTVTDSNNYTASGAFNVTVSAAPLATRAAAWWTLLE